MPTRPSAASSASTLSGGGGGGEGNLGVTLTTYHKKDLVESI